MVLQKTSLSGWGVDLDCKQAFVVPLKHLSLLTRPELGHYPCSGEEDGSGSLDLTDGMGKDDS